MSSYQNRGFAFIPIIIAIAVVAAGGGTYYVVKKSSSAPATIEANATTTVEAEMSATSTSATSTDAAITTKKSDEKKADVSAKAGVTADVTLRSIMAKGGDHKCTFEQVVSNSRSKGTVYISGQNIRGDFESQTTAGNVDSHMLKVGDDIYVWSSAMATMGLKMKVNAAGAANNQSLAAQGVDLDAKLAYECVPVASNASQFVVPASIKFTDLSGLPGGVNAQGGLQIKY